MYSQNEAAKAAFRTGAQNLWDRTDRNTHRMAGGALAAVLLPGMLASIDNQEEDFANQLLSGGITAGGVGLGAYIEQMSQHLTPEQMDDYINNAVNDLKAKSKVDMKESGPQAAADRFGRAKQAVYDEVNPVDPQPGRRKVFEQVTGMDALGRSPRELRGMTRGALIGGLLAAPLAYGVMRNGEIE